MKDFKNLKVWEKSHMLTLEIYNITSSFPNSEQFGIVSQMRRSVSSIPANIAEGCCRDGDKEFVRFLQISVGSASEIKYFILLSKDLGYLKVEEYGVLTQKIDEILKMLTQLVKRIRFNSYNI
jgi:four helix bundle protein